MMPSFPADSIRFRLLALGSVLVGAALIAGYLTIAAILDDFITGRFDAETHAVSEALIAGAGISDSGRLVASRLPADPRFEMPLSGWYWQLSQDGTVVAKSASLFDSTLPAISEDEAKNGLIGPRGATLRLTQSSFTLPDSDSALSVSVTAPQSEIDASLAQVHRPLAISLAILGIALALASLIQVTAGLRSLGKLGQDIRKIRAGEAQSLPHPAVSELRPISTEINNLLEQNRKVLSRSRDYVGNLAHSLKTPLAALANGLPPDHPGQALIARMDRQIGWHLRRARSSAGPRILGHRSPLHAVFDDILLVLRRPIQDRAIRLELRCPEDLAFAGERQDLEEMIGNLTENAVKYTHSRIRISAHAATPDPTGAASDLVITIEDDGPGMSPENHAQAIARGGRLDELGPPGAGLGLAIVVDLAVLHGGHLALEKSDLGGLKAMLTLPAA
ncbi:HAMP domain-containing sensor histidine kinase [Paracoccus sp. (in: a-proteobacteria)]|uniref:HAMP domain-containing sensor histidine kinase n=1 Tax=Paracoccus sp. TaxID=267 RepID=UPI00289E071C|nr:HAMP domain-containing sensor histidine kinase [Paracoccus sp. (in: a-proteobacteria)]